MVLFIAVIMEFLQYLIIELILVIVQFVISDISELLDSFI